MISRVILPGTLSCLFVKIHLRCFGKRHQEILLFSTILMLLSQLQLFLNFSVCDTHHTFHNELRVDALHPRSF